MLELQIRIDPILGQIASRRTGATLRPENFPQTQGAIREALEYTRQVWMSATLGKLYPPMTKHINDREYMESLSTDEAVRYPDPDFFHGAVFTTYPGAKRVEDGYGAFDMKPGLLAGPRKHMGKDGDAYTVVPFRHATPNTPASSGIFSSTMPEPIYRAVKAQGRIVRRDLEELSRVTGNNEFITAGHNSQGYWRRTSFYEGLTKVGAKGHTRYMTFRTVSEKSDPRSWWHPGLPANPIVAAVREFVRPKIERAIREAFLEDLGIIFGA